MLDLERASKRERVYVCVKEGKREKGGGSIYKCLCHRGGAFTGVWMLYS